jgi:hypothetical protein
MADKYTLSVVNNSSNGVDICVYQTQSGLMSLAWIVQHSWPTTTQRFSWTTAYSFVWDETGLLQPGIIFDDSQVWPADPDVMGFSTPTKAGNQVSLTFDQGAYTFCSTGDSVPPPIGSLQINFDKSVPPDPTATAGIGMSGSGTLVLNAQPNLHVCFAPHPRYWVTAGTYTKGEVLDIEQITDSAEIVFEPGVFSMQATLGYNNEWTVGPARRR